MKLVLPFIFLFSGVLCAQNNLIPAAGGGEAPLNLHDEITPEMRAKIMEDIQQNEDYIKTIGKWPATFGQKTSTVSLNFPLAWNDGFSDYGFYGISNYADHNVDFPNVLTDYNCGTRTYDTDGGYNHQGIDYFLWPFYWKMMEDEAVKIVAAAPGMIVGRYDGQFDQNCAFNPGSWNAVYVRHDDGTLAWYGHMKNGSLTDKGLGDMVEVGEYLGLVGSSGNSTGPHLHFEVYDAENNLIDPYSGACNAWNATSWWAVQPDYIEPRVNRIMTHDVPPVFNPCPEPETPNEQNTFSPGQTAYFAIYLADVSETDLIHLKIADALGTVFYEWDFYQPLTYYSASYWYWWYTLPDSPQGIWTWEATLDGEVYTHTFQVGEAISVTDNAVSTDSLNAYFSDETLQIMLFANDMSDYKLQVYTPTGQLLHTEQVQAQPGSNVINISTNTWSKGMYIISAEPLSGENHNSLTTKALTY